MKSMIAALLVAASVVVTTKAQTLNLTRVPADVITFNGQAFTNYKIQVSTNLNDWTDKAIVYGNVSGNYGYTNFPTGQQLYYRTIQLAPGALGMVFAKMDPSSPLDGLIKISDSQRTDDVVLAVYDIKTTVKGTMTTIKIVINTTNASFTELFADITLQIGSMTYSANLIQSNHLTQATIIFTDMMASLPADTYVPMKIVGRINPSANGQLDGAVALVKLNCHGVINGSSNNPVVENDDGVTVPIEGVALTSATITFSSVGALVSDTQITLDTPIESNGVIVGYPVQLGFRVTAGDQTLFLSKNGPIVGSSGQSLIQAINDLDTMFGLTSVSASPEVITGDTVEYFVVPAGSSRQFSLTGTITKAINGPVMTRSVKVTAIAYGLTPYSLYGYHVTHGIGGLEIEHLTF